MEKRWQGFDTTRAQRFYNYSKKAKKKHIEKIEYEFFYLFN